MIPLVITIIGELPVILDAAAKINALLHANGSNFIIQLQTVQANALNTAEDTRAMIAKWEMEHKK